MVNVESMAARREGWARHAWALVIVCAMLLALVACRGGAAESKAQAGADGEKARPEAAKGA